MKACALELLKQVDAAVNSPSAKRLFTEGVMAELSEGECRTVLRAQRIWHFAAPALDAALAAQPHLRDILEEAMVPVRAGRYRDRLPAKMRRAFIFINHLARCRNSKSEAECFIPWALSVYLVSLNAPPIAVDGIRVVLDCCVKCV